MREPGSPESGRGDAEPKPKVGQTDGGALAARSGAAFPDGISHGMLPARKHRGTRIERASMRVLATGGIIGLGTALGSILDGQDIAGWIVGLTVGLVSVILAAVLWSSRQL